MRRHHCGRVHLLVLACALACASGVGAQRPTAGDSMRVLRFQPDSEASSVAPVVITFDRPIAPRLDASVDPRRVITVSPHRDMLVSWRDPSTIVAEFQSAWAPGTTYQVALSQRLRGADGQPLAHTA